MISRALPKNRFMRGVSVLVGGTVGAQIVVVLAAPVLTRLYSPQEFGLLAMFIALLALLSTVTSLCYEQGIPLPDDDRDAAALLVLSLSTLLVFGMSGAILIYTSGDAIAGLLNMPELAAYLFLAPIGILFLGIHNVLGYWAIRMKAFAPLAKTKVSQSVATVGLQIGGAALGPIALLGGQVAGHAAGSVSLGVRVLRHRWEVITGVRFSDVIAVAGRYRKFPLYSTWGGLFNTLGAQMPPVMFAILFGPAAAGVYALAHRVLSMPMQVIGKAIANVFFSDAAQAHREGKLQSSVARIHDRLAHIGMPPILVLLLSGPEIFGQIFGREWREAGVFAQWLAPWLYLVFVTSPLSSLFGVLDRQAAGMVFQAVLLLVRAGAIVAGAWIGNLQTAVALFAACSAACWAVNLVWIMRMSGNSWTDIWRPTLNALAWAVALISPFILATIWGGDLLLLILSLATACVLIAARYTYLIKGAAP